MGELRALRGAGGARGVEEDRVVVVRRSASGEDGHDAAEQAGQVGVVTVTASAPAAPAPAASPAAVCQANTSVAPESPR